MLASACSESQEVLQPAETVVSQLVASCHTRAVDRGLMFEMGAIAANC